MSLIDRLAERLPRDRLWPLPATTRPDGKPRRTGVEIEFSGLTEAAAAQLVARLWGGRVTERSPHVLAVEATRLGEIGIELDTALKDKADLPLADTLLDLSREVVPVEIVTPPLQPDDLAEIDGLLTALAQEGAKGSEDGLLLAFGLHLNPELAAETAGAVVPVARAFALVEQWLRAADPPDLSRRALPFIDPWPRVFVDRIADEGAEWGLDDLRDAYLELVGSRNHGLDLLPLLEHLFPERVRAALPDGAAKGGRPAWHYRLPQTGIGTPGWSFAREWNRWVLVERIAADAPLLDRLAGAWAAHRAALTSLRPNWAHDVSDILGQAEIWDG